ncbi:MAG: MBL fold metallo-hydrolase, partial [Planctomycetes bacterium]|nr:MBL fold metallo-hydrolase [Planctomycetota bacterium]
ASIGVERNQVAGTLPPVKGLFPQQVLPGVFFCGYTSESSFGAASWFVQREQGNILIDSPRWADALVKELEALGGVSKILLTHQDDVADHAKYAAHFGAER